MIVVRYFPSVPPFLSLLFCFILINCEQVILGYIFLFSGSNSEQDESVEDSEALQPSFTNKTSELENDITISVERHAQFYDSHDLHEILDVQRNASPNEIRQAYLKMSKKNYPKIQGENSYDF